MENICAGSLRQTGFAILGHRGARVLVEIDGVVMTNYAATDVKAFSAAIAVFEAAAAIAVNEGCAAG